MKMTNIDVFINDKFLRQRLCNIRKSKGLTQKELSDLSGLSTKTISNIETGENSYTMRSLIRYAGALGFQLDVEKIPEEGDNNDTTG